MTQESFRTIGQLAKQHDQPEWKIRRIVDALKPDVPRIGLYRAVPLDMLPAIAERLSEQTKAAKQAADLVQSLRQGGIDIRTAAELEGTAQ